VKFNDDSNSDIVTDEVLIRKAIRLILKRVIKKERLQSEIQEIEIVSITCPQQEILTNDLLKFAEHLMMETRRFHI